MASVFKRPADSERNPQATVYIGNLDPQVTELLLYELLIQFAPVRSLNCPKDRILKTHQGFGFAEFRCVEDAEYVVGVAKGIRLYGKVLKINKSDLSGARLQPRQGPLGALSHPLDVGAKLFINNLNPLIDEQFLADTFTKIGPLIRPPLIMRTETGESRGYGFMVFEDFGASDRVVDKMNGALLMNQKVDISYAYKEDALGKRTRHGDRAERLLAENAAKTKH